MTRQTLLVTLALGMVVSPAAQASARSSGSKTAVGVVSGQSSSGKATVTTHITSGSGTSSNKSSGALSGSGQEGGGSTAPVVVLPTLASNSPLLTNPTPYGPGSFWYRGSAGEECAYVPDASPVCYVVVAPAVTAADVAADAAQAESELDLTIAPIDANPAATVDGLTGAASWFWLTTAPTARHQSVTLNDESVTVTATPGQITWGFGDGSTLSGGAGVPYRDGAVSAGAVTHVYQTRCLPGDQGHDPEVLASCGPDGYTVSAAVAWTISYVATGPLDETGQLTARTTTSTLTYPVSEVRDFLTTPQP